MSNDVLEAIRADKSLQGGDISKINQLVDQKVLPYVDFEKMTRLAVGRGWRQATPEQRTQLVKEFKTLLTYTYSGALSQISDHKVQLRPFRNAPTDTDVVVRTQVVASKGDPIQLDYRLEKGDAGWKIYDMNILGVWLIENYRKRKAFLEEIKHAIDSEAELYCFFYGVTPELKQVPSKKNPEQTFGVFSANIENLDHFIIREAPGLEAK